MYAALFLLAWGFQLLMTTIDHVAREESFEKRTATALFIILWGIILTNTSFI